MRPEPIAAAIVALAALTGHPARAEARDPARAEARDPAAAEALFREGRRLVKERQYLPACAKLAESYRLDPAAGTLLNLADCEERLGRTASAWEHFRTGADELANNDPRRAAAHARAGALERLLPRLTVTLAAGAPDRTEVSRDGVTLGAASLGVALPLDPGPHRLIARAPGHEPREIAFELRPAEHRSMAIEPGPPLPRAAPPASPAVADGDAATSTPAQASIVAQAGEPTRRGSPIGYAFWAGGALGIGAGVYFGLQARAARQDAANACTDAGDGTRCWIDARASLDRDARNSLFADIGFGIGLASAIVGTYLVFWPSKTEPAATSGKAPGVGLRQAALAPLPGGGAVTVGGSF
jgi:hypothetical protein